MQAFTTWHVKAHATRSTPGSASGSIVPNIADGSGDSIG
jgi:hypothetical protein